MRKSRGWLELILIVGIIAVGAAAYRSAHPPDPPEDAVPELGEGIRLWKAHQYERCLPYFNQPLKRQPDLLRALIYRGSALTALHRFEPAQADLDKACELSGVALCEMMFPRTRARALVERARLDLWRHEYDKAISDSSMVPTLELGDELAVEAHQLHAMGVVGANVGGSCELDFDYLRENGSEVDKTWAADHEILMEHLGKDPNPFLSSESLKHIASRQDGPCPMCEAYLLGNGSGGRWVRGKPAEHLPTF